MSTRYVVPVSGGKDSQVCLSMAVEKYGRDDVIGLHNYTGIDHSLTYAHMKWMEDFYGVPIHTTQGEASFSGMFDLIEKKNMVPGRNARFCTDEFKMLPQKKWLAKQPRPQDIIMLMGMRAQESPKRAEKYGGLSPDDEFSLRDLFPSKIPKYLACVRVRLPIVDRSTPWVFEFMRKRGEKLNPLYARGHKRVGCYPCLLAGMRDWRLAARDPEGRATIIRIHELKERVIASKGIVDASVVLDIDLPQLLRDEDPKNRKNDPFGADIEDPDVDPGCVMCEL